MEERELEECMHDEVEGPYEGEPDYVQRFREACFWATCSGCRKRVLVVNDTGTFSLDEL